MHTDPVHQDLLATARAIVPLLKKETPAPGRPAHALDPEYAYQATGAVTDFQHRNGSEWAGRLLMELNAAVAAPPGTLYLGPGWAVMGSPVRKGFAWQCGTCRAAWLADTALSASGLNYRTEQGARSSAIRHLELVHPDGEVELIETGEVRFVRQAGPVPAYMRTWQVALDDYRPVDVTGQDLLPSGSLTESVADGWAEPALDPRALDWAARQATAKVPFTVVDGAPRNPAGRTGRVGRVFGRFGENLAADAVLTTGTHVLLIRRGEDEGQPWAIPGGMVETGEDPIEAAYRELKEETGADPGGAVGIELPPMVMVDPRATDWSWPVSCPVWFQVPTRLQVKAGTDAADARWWPFTDGVEGLRRSIAEAGEAFFETHADLLDAVWRRLADRDTPVTLDH